jgi:NAD(P)-dependent dehydrogenase (short-subunit alcohol dehydrogenase family)
MNLLEGKVVAITGAASGIGRACALGAAENGAQVALIDRSPCTETSRAIAEAGGKCIDLGCDVRDTDAVTRAFSEIEAKFGRLDALINCAGTMGNWPKPFYETSDEDWNLVIDTNLMGVFACYRAALPAMRRNRAGAIANVASELALVGTAGLVVYGASKAGVIQLSRGLPSKRPPTASGSTACVPGRSTHLSSFPPELGARMRMQCAANPPGPRFSAAWVRPKRSPTSCSSQPRIKPHSSQDR